MGLIPFLFKVISIFLIIGVSILIIRRLYSVWTNKKLVENQINIIKSDIEILENLIIPLQRKHLSKVTYSFLLGEFLDLACHGTDVKSLTTNLLEIKFPILKLIRGYANYQNDIEVIEIKRELEYRKDLVSDYENYISVHIVNLGYTLPWYLFAFGFIYRFEFLLIVPYIAYTWLVIKPYFNKSYRKSFRETLFSYKSSKDTKELIEQIVCIPKYQAHKFN